MKDSNNRLSPEEYKRRKKNKIIGTVLTVVSMLLVLMIVIKILIMTSVWWYSPSKAMKKALEEKAGKEFVLIDEGSEGGVFQAFMNRSVFWGKFQAADNELEKYTVYAERNENGFGYSFYSDYYVIKNKKEIKSELEQIGRECFGEDVEVWYYTGAYAPLEKEYTKEELIDKVDHFSMQVMIDEISDEEAIKASPIFYSRVEELGIKIGQFTVNRNARYPKERYEELYELDDYQDDTISIDCGDVLYEKGFDYGVDEPEIHKPIPQSIREKYNIVDKHDLVGGFIIIKENGKYGVIDCDGNLLIECIGDEWHWGGRDNSIVEIRSIADTGSLHTDAFIYLPTMSTSIGVYDGVEVKDDFLSVHIGGWDIKEKENNKAYFGALDFYCKEIVPCVYDERIVVEGGKLKATKADGTIDYYDFEGNKLN